MTTTDKTINCRDCKGPFIFTAGEQQFYEERGFSAPIRCKACRDAKKQARESGGGATRPVQPQAQAQAQVPPQGFEPDRNGGTPRRREVEVPPRANKARRQKNKSYQDYSSDDSDY